MKGTENRVKAVLKPRHMSEVLNARVFKEKGHVALTYRVNQRGIERLSSTLFGKTIIFTDQSKWSDEQIVLAYRGQYRIEHAFRTMKDPHFITFSPAFHWTNQKIRVHAFYCVLALTIASLLQRHLHHQGIAISISEVLESLND
ncbi:transposase, partial [Streptococcus pseudopneumoniae]